MPLIRISGQIINFPDSSQSPNWAPALVEFAQAVEGVLSTFSGAYDVPPQAFNVTSDVNTNIAIPLLTFPSSDVRSAFIRYALYRTSNTTTEAETGTLEIVYNNIAGTWEISRESTGTNNGWTFDVTSIGIVRFSTTSIAGTFQSATLSYQASAILQAE